MILVIRNDGKALNLDAFEQFVDKKSTTGPTHLHVSKNIGQTYLVENYSVQDMVDDSMGRMGTIIIRRYWREWRTSDIKG